MKQYFNTAQSNRQGSVCSLWRSAFSVSVVLSVLLTASLSPKTAHGGEPGESGYLFLKVGTDARVEAMGGAHTGVADGLGGSHYNPAALADAAPGAWTASYTNWVSDIQSGYIASAWGIGSTFRMAAVIQYLDFGSFLGFDGDGVPTGDFGASDFAAALILANTISDRWAWGLTGRVIAESIDNENSLGLAVDGGIRYAFADNRTRLGIAFRNLGAQTQSLGGGAKDDLPLIGVAGISHRLRGAPMMVAIDALLPNDDGPGLAAGIEFAGLEPLTLRAGYNSLGGKIDTDSDDDKLAGFTLGAGFTLKRVQIDYSYGSLSVLGDAHRFTLRSSL